MEKIIFTKTRILTLIIMTICCFNQGYSQSPILQWAKRMGNSGSTDEGNAIAVDASGNVYTTGYYGDSVFVSKLNSSGNPVWLKKWGGYSLSIALDASGNIYTTGSFGGTVDFDPGSATSNLTASGSGDIFISKLDASGNFAWAKQMGGSGYDLAYSITLDASGNIYSTGSYEGTADFNPGTSTNNLTSAGGHDIFVSKLDASGNYVWAKSMGGTNWEYGLSIAVDAAKNVYTTGYFPGTVDFDPGSGTANLTSSGSWDIFISKLDASGNFAWAKKIGGTTQDGAYSITSDASGNVFTTGYFDGTVDFDPGSGTANLTSTGNWDIFILKLNTSGNFAWAKKIGGAEYDVGYSVALDKSGNIYATGYFADTVDFDPGTNVFDLYPHPSSNKKDSSDIYILKLDSSGNFEWAKGMGGGGDDNGKDIAVDSLGGVYTTGRFWSTADFDPDAGTLNLTSLGYWDLFIHKMSLKTSGLTDNNYYKELTIYPNPTNGIFNISLSQPSVKTNIEVYNTLGALIFKTISNDRMVSFDLKDEANGIYIVKVTGDDNFITTRKLILQ